MQPSRRVRFFYAAITAAAGMLAITAFAVPAASASTSASTVSASVGPASTGWKGVRLSSNPLGVNVGPWQTADLITASRQRMEAGLKRLGPAIAVRYGGGVFADADNEMLGRNTNGVSQGGYQTSDFTGSDSRRDALPWRVYAPEARAVHANVMVTINYGTGTPALAGAWLGSIRAHHDPVSEVEIGNEPYGCSSPDKEITEWPVDDRSYEPNDPYNCPYTQAGSGSAGIRWYAWSFIAHAPAFIRAVRRADPSVKVMLPYAISPPRNSGYLWDALVMRNVRDYQGINVLWYPSLTGWNPPAQTALSWLTQIPARAASVRADLRNYAPKAFWVIGEDNIANHPIQLTCTPTAAVFAAASALAWLAQGARNVNWWGQSFGNNAYGRCGNRDFGMFDRTGYPEPPYWGFLLASSLAQPHASLSIINTGNSHVLAYHSTLVNGRQAEAFVNIDAGRSEWVRGQAIGGGRLTRLQYGSSRARIVQTRVPSSAVTGITLPRDSVTVFMN
jgi:hypothetical protein